MRHPDRLVDCCELGWQAEVIGVSLNQRIQKDSAVLHGEMATLKQAGRLKAYVCWNSVVVRCRQPAHSQAVRYVH
ncbi:hypothetical protein DFH11DRAFT_1615513 [Phellopilus nigrolimitatus]|nr:hypothetical protein DFH11DRAFT_1615513 [Phellopilus nigrolimitatus]